MSTPKPNKCNMEFRCPNGVINCVYYKPGKIKTDCAYAVDGEYYKEFCESTIAKVNKAILFLKSVKFGKNNLLNFIREEYDGQDIPE